MSIIVPPIKCQGIKTKLVPKIRILVQNEKFSRWVEPFAGSGVVGFNMFPANALLCDSNPYLIAFYNALKSGEITEEIALNYLLDEGALLRTQGETHYYDVRERFNKEHSPLDFLFLNRACFNGVMRFNSKGKFNVPFCRKTERFAQAYITKIVNQIGVVRKIIQLKNFEFLCQDFRTTISSLQEGDFLYCDPPYIDRHTDYFNQWSERDEADLIQMLKKTPVHFVLSTWKGNEFRENKYIETYSQFFSMETQEHFYHIGGSVSNRHSMEEAFFLNFSMPPLVWTQAQMEQPLLNF